MATALNCWAWSVTPADNDDADSAVIWTEGQDPGTVNGSARAMMSALKKLTNVLTGNVTVSGTNAIVITTGQTIDAAHQALGFRVCFKAAGTNTGATTVAVDGLTAVAVKRPNGDALSAGDIVLGGFYDIAFDGTNYILLGAGASTDVGTVAGNNTWSGTNIFSGNVTVGDAAGDVVVIKGTTVNSTISAPFSSTSVAVLADTLLDALGVETKGALLQHNGSTWVGGTLASFGEIQDSSVASGGTYELVVRRVSDGTIGRAVMDIA